MRTSTETVNEHGAISGALVIFTHKYARLAQRVDDNDAEAIAVSLESIQRERDHQRAKFTPEVLAMVEEASRLQAVADHNPQALAKRAREAVKIHGRTSYRILAPLS